MLFLTKFLVFSFFLFLTKYSYHAFRSIESVPMQLSNPAAVSGNLHSCNCKQYYEANVQIHESIVNYLEEIRVIRNEIRQFYEESRQYEVEEPFYQVIEET